MPLQLYVYDEATEGDAQTTFHGTIDLMESASANSKDGELMNIRFVGDGSGYGVLLHAPIFITSCTFSGYEYAIRNNKTAVALIHMPKNANLYFTNCVYEGNEVDFDNQAGN